MTSWIPISVSAHASAHWRRRKDYKFVSKDQIAPVQISEIIKLLPQFTLGFLKKDKGFEFIAVLGVDGKRNLYVTDEGKWLGSYVPAAFRGYPFALADDGKEGRILCIEESRLSKTTEAEAEPLFDADGNMADLTAQVVDFLKQCDQGYLQTRHAVAELASAGLIEEWKLTVSRGDAAPAVNFQGLYQINERKLQEMDADGFAKLRPSGALHIAFAQVFSVNQVEILSQRALFLEQNSESTAALDGVGELFQDDGVLNFDSLKI